MKVFQQKVLADSQNVIQFGTSTFFVLENQEALNNPLIHEVDALIISTENEKEYQKMVEKIRLDSTRNVYLKPLFASDNLALVEPSNIHVDGFSDMAHFSYIANAASKINERIADLMVVNSSMSFEFEVSLNILRFMYTRRNTMVPLIDEHAKMGYNYPIISLYYPREDAEKGFKTLIKLAEDGSLQSKLMSKVHGCGNCDHSFLHFRETCPNCHSVDFVVDDLVHHFVCATVAPEADFRKGDQLECPKCEKHLRHIGVDYDKPSAVSTCKNCQEYFQTSDMRAHCMSCDHDNELSELSELPVNSYQLTAKGERIAIKGFIHKVVAKENALPPGTINLDFFEFMLIEEKLRVHSKGSTSFFGRISMSDDSVEKLNDKSKDLLKFELASAIKEYLDPADILGVGNYKTFYFILPDISEKDAEHKISTLGKNLTQLVGDKETSIDDRLVEVEMEAVSAEKDLTSFKPL